MRVYKRNSVGFAQVQNLLDMEQFRRLKTAFAFSHYLLLRRKGRQGWEEFRPAGNMPIVLGTGSIGDHQHEAFCVT